MVRKEVDTFSEEGCYCVGPAVGFDAQLPKILSFQMRADYCPAISRRLC